MKAERRRRKRKKKTMMKMKMMRKRKRKSAKRTSSGFDAVRTTLRLWGMKMKRKFVHWKTLTWSREHWTEEKKTQIYHSL